MRIAKFITILLHDDLEEHGFNETANKVNNPQEAMIITCRYKDIIKSQNKKAIGYIGKQQHLLKNLRTIFR